MKFKEIVDFIEDLFGECEKPIPLHSPIFCGNEKKYINECIDSTFVSSTGEFVDRFEEMVASFTGAGYAVSTVNGTAALHMALMLAGVKRGDNVLTQAVTFVATTNAITYCGAHPVFLDSDRDTLGLSPEALEAFLAEYCEKRDDGFTYDREMGRRITACVAMHVFGHPVRIEEIKSVCERYNIALVEDAAESLGSFFKGRHTGTFGNLGILSFNGNKTITTGGGGMLLTDNAELAKKAKHLTTTAKVSHPWELSHDSIGYNYRLPNINAALGCAQMEMLPLFLEKKRELSIRYKKFFESLGVPFVSEPVECRSNYWLNAIILDGVRERNEFLEYVNNNGVIVTRPLWTLMNKLPMYAGCKTDGLENARWLEERIVNIPSGVIM
ncbi:MAG: LegC family aminotransferase [Deltaproteobacteria bacterium]|nr:LegC family aminotransferase [Deltaproteobacteria bacterium]